MTPVPWRRWLLSWRLMIVLGAVLVAAGLLRQWLGPSVEVAAAQRIEFVDRIVATGRVMPPARIGLGATGIGTVKAVHAQEGDRVQAGQIIIELDDTEAQAAVAQAEAAVQQAQAKLRQLGAVAAVLASERVREAMARLDQARLRHEREIALASQGASTPERVDDAAKALDIATSQRDSALAEEKSHRPGGGDSQVAAAAIAVARASLDLAKARLAQTRIASPAGAIVLARRVEPGDVVQPGRPLIDLARDGSARLTVDVDEKYLPLLKVGQLARASADAFEDNWFDAEVAYLAPCVDPGRGTIEVRLTVDKAPVKLLTDMSVSVDIAAGTRQGVLAARAEAVRDAESASPWVLLLEGNRLTRRSVRVGARAGALIEVMDGLNVGDLVAIGKGANLAHGSRVRPRVVASESSHAL